jgi:hypothetical protein
MQFVDAVTVAGTRRREDGYLVADARIARTGVQEYLGSEVGKPDMATVRVYRPGSEVFAEDTLKSAAHQPVTNDHPPEMVNSENWRKFAVGQTGDEVAGEGIFIRVPLMVSDEAAIKDIEAGKRELSAGYTCELDFTPGTTATGDAYDAIQKNIRLNHVAIVSRGRAGSQVRIGDGAVSWGASPVTSQTADERTSPMADALRKMLVDGLQVETTDAGAAAIEKLLGDKKTLETKLSDAEKANALLFADTEKAHATALADKDKVIAAKDADLAKKDAEIDALKGKIVDGAALDKLVAARADLVATAKTIAKDVKTDGLSDADIRKAVVIAKRGDAVKDKAPAYFDAAFDILVEDAKAAAGADPFAKAVADGLVPTGDGNKVVVDAYSKMIADMKAGKTTETVN